MTGRWARPLLAAILIVTLGVAVCGCWDSRELDTLFIITGIALDKGKLDDEMNITLQIGKAKAKESGASSESANEGPLLLTTENETVLGGLTELNRDSSRTLLLQHNQVILMGAELAEQGIQRRIDLFMRDRESRMEVLVLVAEGRASDVLAAQIDQEILSGMFLSRVIRDLRDISPCYEVRVLDLASLLIDETTSPAIPLVKVTDENDKQAIEISGMAVFKGDRMVGRLDNEEVTGYTWAMGHVEHCSVEAKNELGHAVLQIIRMDPQRKVTIREDGGVRVSLSVETSLNVGELVGFHGITTLEILPYLSELARQEIVRRIEHCFDVARSLNADIYGIGAEVHRRYPKEWKTMKDRWDDLFPDTELDIQVKVRIPRTGQVVQSLERRTNQP